jgi:hypothetical protein
LKGAVVRVTSKQYEELCRYYIANMLKIDIGSIVSVNIPNPLRSGLPAYKHQIDLYWETEDEMALYLNIANAKWRQTSKVDQPDIMLLQQVKQKVSAHKAIMLTNKSYTSGAIAAAKDEGIGLHIVRPNIDISKLPKTDLSTIQTTFNELAQKSKDPIYNHKIETKHFYFAYANDDNASKSHDVESWYIEQLKRRLNYLLMLWNEEYDVDVAAISELEDEIENSSK